MKASRMSNPYQPPLSDEPISKVPRQVNWKKVQLCFGGTVFVFLAANTLLLSCLRKDQNGDAWAETALAVINLPAIPIFFLIIPCVPVPMGEEFRMGYEYVLIAFVGVCGSLIWGLIAGAIARWVFREPRIENR
jgi:hypothetical protein